MLRFLLSVVVGFALASLMLSLSGCSSKRVHYTKPGHTSVARYRATMRTYRVRGRTYHPTYVKVGDTMTGISSWYGSDFHGKMTSNGEQYDMHAHTAAHKTWPMDTMVRVENLENGKSTVVRINDRGPFVAGRVIDCSYAAGKELGLDKTGIAKVKLTVLGFAGKIYRPSAEQKRDHAEPPSVHLSDFGVQVGAFRRRIGAEITRRKYTTITRTPKHVIIREFTVGGLPLYRVWVMGFGSAEEAKDFIADRGITGGFVIRP